MPTIWYNRGKTRVCAGDVALDTGDIRMLLVTGTITGASDPDLDTVADLDAVAGVGIHTERVALSTKTVTQDDTNDRANMDSDNVTFASSVGVSALAAVIYDEGGGTDATRHLLTFDSTNFPRSLDGGLNVNTPNGWARAT